MPGKAGDAWAALESSIQETLLTADQIQGKVSELAARISADYEDKDLLLVGVLNGSVVFLADLMRLICLPLEVDFVAVSSYGEQAVSSGEIRILKDLARPIADRDVLVAEDIVDTGRTLRRLLDELASRGPASLRVCCLLDKPSRREVDLEPDYCGAVIPDAFVVGYGLDCGHRYRNLPYIGVLRPDAYPQGGAARAGRPPQQ